MRFPIPELTQAGFRLVGGRLMVGDGRPAGMLMYENGQGHRIGLGMGASARQGASALWTGCRRRRRMHPLPCADARQGLGFHRSGPRALASGKRIDAAIVDRTLQGLQGPSFPAARTQAARRKTRRCPPPRGLGGQVVSSVYRTISVLLKAIMPIYRDSMALNAALSPVESSMCCMSLAMVALCPSSLRPSK